MVPSGTMGNLASILAHCERGTEIILGNKSHTFIYEAGGISSFGGIHSRQLNNDDDVVLDTVEEVGEDLNVEELKSEASVDNKDDINVIINYLDSDLLIDLHSQGLIDVDLDGDLDIVAVEKDGDEQFHCFINNIFSNNRRIKFFKIRVSTIFSY